MAELETCRDSRSGKGEEGYWLDLRSKRDITPALRHEGTCGGYRYYDPLLSPKIGVVEVFPDFAWLEPGHTRSWQLNVHSFRFADYWILQYLEDGDASRLNRLEDVALDYGLRVWEAQCRSEFEFVCSDVSVASRAAVFAFLLGRARSGAYVSRDPVALSRLLAGHVAWAADDANYNSNNHGLFNDMHLLLGLINAPGEASLLDAAPRLVARLLETFLQRQVNDEGVHLEHTPAYALLWVLLGRKIELILSRLSDRMPEFSKADERLEETLQRVSANLWWFTKPNGELINLGDQGRTEAPRWVREQEGVPGTKHFPRSGYAFHRDEGTYLAFAAAYHATKVGRLGYRSASHKQRDELQLIWSEGGQDILIDTGLRSYDFGPERRYTYSKQAHNTLSLCPGDYLTDGILEYMDATSPYGGAIDVAVDCAEGSGWVLMAGHDPLLQAKGISHWRLPLLLPGRWLVVVDLSWMPNGGKAEWNFHLAESWRCTSYGARDATFRTNERTLRISRFAASNVQSAKGFLHRGEFEPLRGWRFAGDPFAVSNLRFIEWLPGRKLQLRATAFALGGADDTVRSVVLQPESGMLAVSLQLAESVGVRQVDARMPAPPELLNLLSSGVPGPGSSFQ